MTKESVCVREREREREKEAWENGDTYIFFI